MTNSDRQPRIDTASRVIRASPHEIYQAFLDPEAIVRWRPPAGMQARIEWFDSQEGGGYRMAFEYLNPPPGGRGKTTAGADVFEGTFVKLIPDQRIVEQIQFESTDPAFAEPMVLTTTLIPVEDGTEVIVRAEQVPDPISPADHRAGMESSLANLARFVE